MVAAVVVASVLTGAVCLLLGAFRLGNIVRFVPYPVIGGFLAGTGWLLVKGGIGVASGIGPTVGTLRELLAWGSLARWLPALVFAVALTVGVRVTRWPLLIPAALGIGLVAFAIGIVVTGSSIAEAQAGGWLLGPFPRRPVAAVGGARDRRGGLGRGVPGVRRDRDRRVRLGGRDAVERERDRADAPSRVRARHRAAGRGHRERRSWNRRWHPRVPRVQPDVVGQRMAVPARVAGLIAAGVALATLVFGASLVALIPRMLLGGVVLLLGLGFLWNGCSMPGAPCRSGNGSSSW